jgi:hypothetical protein
MGVATTKQAFAMPDSQVAVYEDTFPGLFIRQSYRWLINTTGRGLLPWSATDTIDRNLRYRRDQCGKTR